MSYNSLSIHSVWIRSPQQSSFRPNHNTVIAVLKVTNDIRKGIENTRFTVLALVDFSNAFGIVTYEAAVGC